MGHLHLGGETCGLFLFNKNVLQTLYYTDFTTFEAVFSGLKQNVQAGIDIPLYGKAYTG